MRNLFTKGAALMALVGAFALASVAPAEAALMVRIDVGDGSPTTITDQGAGDFDTMFGTGTISFLVMDGVWRSSGSGASYGTSPFGLGSAASPQMDTNSLDISTQTGGTIVISLTQTGFTSGSRPFFLSIGGTTDGTISYSAFWDAADNPFATTTQIGPTLSFGSLAMGQTGNDTAFAGSAVGGPAGDGMYSLTQVITITQLASANPNDPSQNTSFDAIIRVPEPASIALFGLGLAGVGLITRRRSRIAKS